MPADLKGLHEAIQSPIAVFASKKGEGHAVVVTEEDLVRDGFGERPRFEVLLAEDAKALNRLLTREYRKGFAPVRAG